MKKIQMLNSKFITHSLEETGSIKDSDGNFILLDCTPEEEKILTKNMKDLRETIRPYNIKQYREGIPPGQAPESLLGASLVVVII